MVKGSRRCQQRPRRNSANPAIGRDFAREAFSIDSLMVIGGCAVASAQKHKAPEGRGSFFGGGLFLFDLDLDGGGAEGLVGGLEVFEINHWFVGCGGIISHALTICRGRPCQAVLRAGITCGPVVQSSSESS